MPPEETFRLTLIGTRKPDYGIDAPYAVASALVGGILGVSAGLILRVAVPSSPYWSIPFQWGIVGLAFASVFVASSKWGKLWLRDQIIDRIDWKGDERVLDVGCGRGALLIAAAKKLTSGKAIGIDIWRASDQSGHSPQRTLENAIREGVADRIEIRTADARDLPFESSTFDVVVSGLVIHNIPGGERAKALEEMVRALKPGGKLAVFDIWGIWDYARVLRGLGLQQVQRSYTFPLFFCPTGVVTATKPPGSPS